MSLYTNVCPGRPYTSSHFVILLSVHFAVVLPVTKCDSQYKQLPLYKIAVIVFCSCHNLLLLSVFRCHSPALAYNAIVHGLYHWHTLLSYSLTFHRNLPSNKLVLAFPGTSNKLVCKLLSISSQPSMIQSCCEFWGRSMI